MTERSHPACCWKAFATCCINIEPTFEMRQPQDTRSHSVRLLPTFFHRLATRVLPNKLRNSRADWAVTTNKVIAKRRNPSAVEYIVIVGCSHKKRQCFVDYEVALVGPR